jgi:hypothetical protein
MQCYSWCLDKNHVMPALKKLGFFFGAFCLVVCLSVPKPVLVRGLMV